MQPRTSSSSTKHASTTHELFSDICKLYEEYEKCAIKFIPSWIYNSDGENSIDVMQCLSDMTLNNIVSEEVDQSFDPYYYSTPSAMTYSCLKYQKITLILKYCILTMAPSILINFGTIV